MNILLLIYLSLLVMAIIAGASKTNMWVFHVDLNTLKSPYFSFGINFTEAFYQADKDKVINKRSLTIGFVVISIVVDFYKFYGMTQEQVDELTEGIHNSTLEGNVEEALPEKQDDNISQL